MKLDRVCGNEVEFCDGQLEFAFSIVLDGEVLASNTGINGLRMYDDVLDVTREVECRPGEFRCSDNQTCVSRSKLCNRRRDCPDGSDELDCRMYSLMFVSQFPAFTKTCINVAAKSQLRCCYILLSRPSYREQRWTLSVINWRQSSVELSQRNLRRLTAKKSAKIRDCHEVPEGSTRIF